MLQLESIPLFRSKLKLLSSISSFDAISLQSSAKSYSNACAQLCASPSVPKLLSVLLSHANVMNAGLATALTVCSHELWSIVFLTQLLISGFQIIFIVEVCRLQVFLLSFDFFALFDNLLLTACRANGSHLSLVHYMRKALTAADSSVMTGIDALKDIVSIMIKSSLGDLSESLRSCLASLSFTETFIEQLQEPSNHSDDRFLHHAQVFVDAARNETAAAQVAVAIAVQETQAVLDFFGVDMKLAKVSFSMNFHRILSFLSNFEGKLFLSCILFFLHSLRKAGTHDENLAALAAFLHEWVAAEKEVAKLNRLIPEHQSTPQWLLKVPCFYRPLLLSAYFIFLSEQTRARSCPFHIFRRYFRSTKRPNIFNPQLFATGSITPGSC